MKPILCIEFLAAFAWILLAEAYGAGENKLTVAMLRSATQTAYNSILFELQREGFFEEAHKKYGAR